MTDLQHDGKLVRLVEMVLQEDIGMGDVTTEATVPENALGHARILIKEPGVIAGLEIAELVFQTVDQDLQFTYVVRDGTQVEPGLAAATVEGSMAGMLKAERTALNILQRMSGIATMTRTFVDAVRGTKVKITDTRKTAPGLRMLDKRAVAIGGGVNHRFGLDDMILIKNNHISAAGSIDAAIERCVQHASMMKHPLKIEVETRNLGEVRSALLHKEIHRIMLDNFSVGDMKSAVEVINHAVEVEASGNVSIHNVRSIAETGVDFISVGALTHSPEALDISLTVTSRTLSHSL